ncbi:VOC family protein [Devosia pacifica]|uniref:VOC family protein n=1 Tax=Devosia pacifica TaxID=1335967 RepID=A0A918RV25_9HYPH|nr:VOC family protein [Devosia pacifica]GHA09924.1 VOC family protein [Devosia pacifica]
MAIQTVAHINFNGQARDALSFYQTVFGGDLALVTHAQAYGTLEASVADLVSWGQVSSPEGFSVMAFDVPPEQPFDAGKKPFFVSVRGGDIDEIAAYWKKLSEDATIIQPLAQSGWAKLYGMLKDKFGVTWVLDVPAYPA